MMAGIGQDAKEGDFGGEIMMNGTSFSLSDGWGSDTTADRG